jgi:hypothetical protein
VVLDDIVADVKAAPDASSQPIFFTGSCGKHCQPRCFDAVTSCEILNVL